MVGTAVAPETIGFELGETEVEQLGVATGGNEDVARLDVAMDDPGTVGGVERIGNLERQRQLLVQRHAAGDECVLQRPALEPLHGNERLPVVLADLINGANCRDD